MFTVVGGRIASGRRSEYDAENESAAKFMQYSIGRHLILGVLTPALENLSADFRHLDDRNIFLHTVEVISTTFRSPNYDWSDLP